ncbi:hypothetical protein D3C73_1014280 [compost metagenome]
MEELSSSLSERITYRYNQQIQFVSLLTLQIRRVYGIVEIQMRSKILNQNEMDGGCILELNDKVIILRKNNVITVDDKKLNGTVDFPFYGLGLGYQVGDIA